MAKRVVLHIGTMKSGTSFVQSALTSNPALLESAGARFLGGRFGRQATAVRDVYRYHRRPQRHTRWQALADEARAFPGEVGIVSMEFLSFARPGQPTLFLDPLAGLDVEVVLTVRDQLRATPAQWQTFTRNFGTDDWETYLRRIESTGLRPGGRSRAAKTFHRAQDVVPMLERWSASSGVRRVTVVTLPPPGAPRDELWRRFCEAARVPAEEASLAELHDNASLGYASCDVLRRLNVDLADVRPRRYRKAMRPLARDALVPLRDDEGRPELDRRGAEVATERNQAIREAVVRRGYHLVGSLDDLPVAGPGRAPERVSPPPHAHVVRAAEAVRAYAAGLVEPDLEPRRDAAAAGEAGLDELVEESVRLLRKAHRWGL